MTPKELAAEILEKAEYETPKRSDVVYLVLLMVEMAEALDQKCYCKAMPHIPECCDVCKNKDSVLAKWNGEL